MDNNGEGTKDKDITTLQAETIQSRYREPAEGGGTSILSFLVRAGELVAPWWSKQRDIDLMDITLRSNHLSGAIAKVSGKLAAITPRVEPRDNTIKRHIRLADEYNRILLEDSEMGQGWPALLTKGLWDLFTQDNGLFWEVLGDGPKDGEIIGPSHGLVSLDSQRCTRTANPEFPVVYTDTDGKKYVLHHTRVIFLTDNPIPRAEKNGIGFCWTSRCIDKVQNLIDIAIYGQEKLGSRPLRQIIIGKGITAEQIWQAIMMSEESMDNQALRRYSKNVVIGSPSSDIDIETRDLASVPDGFDEKTSNDLAMFLIAMAGRFPPSFFWPATTVGATLADAGQQHVGGASGFQFILDLISLALGGPATRREGRRQKFLPPSLKLVFDLIDDEQDERQANIRETRSATRERNLAIAVTDIRTEREKMLTAGDITQEQFNRLELEDGRLPDGNVVLTLFHSGEPEIQRLLSLSVGDPLDVEMNRENTDFILSQIDQRILDATAEMVNAGRASQQNRATQAIAALRALRELYEPGQVEDEPEEPEMNEDDTDSEPE